MKVISLIFLVCLVSYTYGWVARGTTPDDKKEGHPDQCWYEEIGYIKSGVTKKLPKECVAIICDKGGEFTLNGCGTQSFDPACKLKEPDLSKPYPDCCKRECVKER